MFFFFPTTLAQLLLLSAWSIHTVLAAPVEKVDSTNGTFEPHVLTRRARLLKDRTEVLKTLGDKMYPLRSTALRKKHMSAWSREHNCQIKRVRWPMGFAGADTEKQYGTFCHCLNDQGEDLGFT